MMVPDYKRAAARLTTGQNLCRLRFATNDHTAEQNIEQRSTSSTSQREAKQFRIHLNLAAKYCTLSLCLHSFVTESVLCNAPSWVEVCDAECGVFWASSVWATLPHIVSVGSVGSVGPISGESGRPSDARTFPGRSLPAAGPASSRCCEGYQARAKGDR